MDNENHPTTANPGVTRLRTGMFSAESGFYLATFLAVTVTLALVVRFVCRRYCSSYCSKCAPKQDPPEDSTLRIAVESRRASSDNQNHLQNGGTTPSTRPPVQWTPPRVVSNSLEDLPSVHGRPTTSVTTDPSSSFGDSSNAYRALKKEHHRGKRGSHICLAARTMQTLYEEDGNEELEDSPQRSVSPLAAGPSQLTGIVYTFSSFPNHESPETERVPPVRFANPTLTRAESAPNNLKECSDPTARVTDLPPSYEDLFPGPDGVSKSSGFSKASASAYTKIDIDGKKSNPKS